MSAPDVDERGAIEHFLAANRSAVLAVLEGLGEQDARRAVVPSDWTPLDLIAHLAGMERHWFLRVISGDTSDTPARAGPVDSLTAATDAYRWECRRSDAILARAQLDDEVAFNDPAQLVGEVTTVRGVLLHVIEETARHAGHLDIARELIDGRTGLGPR